MFRRLHRLRPVLAASTLPVFTWDDVQLRSSVRDCYVISGREVFDVTEFIQLHPGGPKQIAQACGGEVAPYWDAWPEHLGSPRVAEVLEKYQVGVMSPDYEEVEFEDPPEAPLKPGFFYWDTHPLQCAPPKKALWGSHVTPQPLVYTRCHSAVPDTGDIDYFYFGDTRITIEELKARSEVVTIESVLQCCANRFRSANIFKQTSMPDAPRENDGGNIANCLWTGVRLLDFLHACEDGKGEEGPLGAYTHLEFEAHDGYRNSVALADLHEDCILAWEVNGTPLSPEHGHPLRVILPGIIGAKNVKSVLRVRLLKDRGDSPWASNYYHIGGEPCVHFGLDSTITHMEGGRVFGVAMGFGVEVASVRVCRQGDFKHYVMAALEDSPCTTDNKRPWGWVRWSTPEIPAEWAGSNISAYAIDVLGNQQPLYQGEVWNENAYMNNAADVFDRR